MSRCQRALTWEAQLCAQDGCPSSARPRWAWGALALIEFNAGSLTRTYVTTLESEEISNMSTGTFLVLHGEKSVGPVDVGETRAKRTSYDQCAGYADLQGISEATI